MSIHYGLQFTKLLELKAKELASAACAVADYTYEARVTHEKHCEVLTKLDAAELELRRLKTEMMTMTTDGPFKAVNKYKEFNGKWPI